jgi:hypothetical protein
MARAKRHFLPGHAWHSPVKQRKKRFNGVNNSPMPQERISFKACQRQAEMALLAASALFLNYQSFTIARPPLPN